GCDMVLACNDRRAALEIVHGLEDPDDPAAHLRLVRLHGRGQFEREALRASAQWQRAVRLLADPLAPLDEAAATAT
ncbi:MAG TPA: beta-N-acetylhexosaminidase, partial [Plasticicumulans sp.]|nr:beta-N-acetylhexosaminidase [Plasticicumulans sp.]